MDEENQINDKLQRKRELTNARVKKYRERKRMEFQQVNSSMQDDPNEEMESMPVQEKIAERKKAMAKERSRRYREKKRQQTTIHNSQIAGTSTHMDIPIVTHENQRTTIHDSQISGTSTNMNIPLVIHDDWENSNFGGDSDSTMSRNYRYCFVPSCTNTSVSAPGKEFISVPSQEPQRSFWIKVAGRDIIKSPVTPKTHLCCCEDHFDLENDMENWMKFKFYREAGLRTVVKLKPGVVPHKFDCQQGRQAIRTKPRENVFQKVRKRKLLKELLDPEVPGPSVVEETSEAGGDELAVEVEEDANEPVSSLALLSSLTYPDKVVQLEEDLENYIYFKYYTNKRRLKLKPHVVPHIFSWQSETSIATTDEAVKLEEEEESIDETFVKKEELEEIPDEYSCELVKSEEPANDLVNSNGSHPINERLIGNMNDSSNEQCPHRIEIVNPVPVSLPLVTNSGQTTDGFAPVLTASPTISHLPKMMYCKEGSQNINVINCPIRLKSREELCAKSFRNNDTQTFTPTRSRSATAKPYVRSMRVQCELIGSLKSPNKDPSNKKGQTVQKECKLCKKCKRCSAKGIRKSDTLKSNSALQDKKNQSEESNELLNVLSRSISSNNCDEALDGRFLLSLISAFKNIPKHQMSSTKNAVIKAIKTAQSNNFSPEAIYSDLLNSLEGNCSTQDFNSEIYQSDNSIDEQYVNSEKVLIKCEALGDYLPES